jgi:TatD DNase family protein
MNLADTHCHLDFGKFDSDRTEVMDRARAAGVSRILIPAVTLPSSLSAVKLAESDPMLFAAIGVHPTDALTWDDGTAAALRELASNPKVVAIGEIGLDYYWDAALHDVQQRVLREQLDLATGLELPVVIHLREAGDAEDGDCAREALTLLEDWANSLERGGNPLADRPGVLHSFSGSASTARRAIDLHFYIGVTGPVTFKNAVRRQQLIASLPLERLLIETDAPFLSPEPRRGRRNEPANVAHIADKIASLHSRTPEEIAAFTSENARRLFRWGETT